MALGYWTVQVRRPPHSHVTDYDQFKYGVASRVDLGKTDQKETDEIREDSLSGKLTTQDERHVKF